MRDKDRSDAKTNLCQVKLPNFTTLPWPQIKYFSLAPCATPEIRSCLNLLIDTPTAVL